MNGLNQVKQAVLEALEAAGLRALGRHGDQDARSYDGPVAVVGVAQATGTAMGLGGYLGCACDGETGAVRELYGRRLDLVISLDVYAPGGADACEAAMERAAEALLEGLPAGLRPGALSWGAADWVREEQLYVRRGTLACTAYFTAAVDQETGTLLDFILKGVMRDAQHST